MAKPVSPKGQVIRAAIQAHPHMGNTKLAELINDSAERLDDKIKVKVNDVANQRLALKKKGGSAAEPAAVAQVEPGPAAGNGRKRGGRKPGRKQGKKAVTRKAAPASTGSALPEPTAPSAAVVLLSKVFDLATEVGGFGELKQLVDRLAGIAKG
jgi:hypothetical protein